jgi:predicted TIM-barrel fold metal-dependent hydrolase
MADSPLDKPNQLNMLIALKRYPKVFVKVSHTWSLSKQPYPYLDSQAQVKRLYDSFGPQRLMAGTDWPLVEGYCGYAKAVAIVRDQMKFLNDDDKNWMMSKTIERVWRLRKAASATMLSAASQSADRIDSPPWIVAFIEGFPRLRWE